MARRFTAKAIPAELMPETVHTSRVVYFYPDKSPFSEGDAVLIGDARPAPSGIAAKVLRGLSFTGGDFKVLTATKHFGGEWYGWLMPSDMQEGDAIRAALAETRKRRKNPRKFDRCVMEVKRRGGARNPYAVCTAAGLRRKNPRSYGRGITYDQIARTIARLEERLKKAKAEGDTEEIAIVQNALDYWKPKSRRKNPRYKRSSASVLARGGPLYTLIAQRPGGKRLVYTGAKFAQGGRPQLFKSVGAVKTAAKFLRLKYPVLKPYSFYVREAR